MGTHKKLWMGSAGPLVSVATMGSIGLKCLWNCSWEFVDSVQPHSPFIFNTSPPILVSGSVILFLVLSSVGLMLASGFQSGIRACFLLASDLCDIAPARCVFFLSWILSCMESPTSWSFDYSVVSPHVLDHVQANSSSSWSLCSCLPSSASAFSDFSNSGLQCLFTCYQTPGWVGLTH